MTNEVNLYVLQLHWMYNMSTVAALSIETVHEKHEHGSFNHKQELKALPQVPAYSCVVSLSSGTHISACYELYKCW